MECCECPTAEWCTADEREWNGGPAWCKLVAWADAGVDAADGSAAMCAAGRCVPKTPGGWDGPVTLYPMIFDLDADVCPEGTTVIDGQYPPGPLQCPTCECAPPTNSCDMNLQWDLSSHDCGSFDSGTKTPFSPPSGWDGACDPTGAMPAGKKTPSGDFYATSIRIRKPDGDMIEPTCASITKKMELPILEAKGDGGQRFARACVGDPGGVTPTFCGDKSTDKCLTIPSGAYACIMHGGDVACPAGWPQKHTLYKKVEDNRTCSDCSCGPVENASCTAELSVFGNGLCSNESKLLSWTLSGINEVCAELVGGPAISGKSMTKIVNDPGKCTPHGGEEAGQVKLEEPFTVCCLSDEM